MKDLATYRHLFFDLDDTLTSSRSLVDQDMADLLRALPVDLIVVSGAENKQITAQLPNLPFFHLGQNGNHARTSPVDGVQNEIWERRLTVAEKNEILLHASKILSAADWPIIDVHDLVEDRGSQIGFSLIGHHEDKERKRTFDPTSEKRFELLKRIPFNSSSVEVKVGGTTCFDYFKKGHHKGSNVRALIEHMGWKMNDAVYFGDKLMPGGNDETVVDIIDTVEVRSHRDTFEKLKHAFVQK
jgi:HAD superfamily hydrolase (TIGR01484 family)